jgi:hypothetical protein
MALKTPNGRRFPPRDPPAADLAAYVARAVSTAACRYRARLVVHAPADVFAGRLPPTVGPVEAIDERTCHVSTGVGSVETLALWAGMLDPDWDVARCPEFVARLELIARRCARACSFTTASSWQTGIQACHEAEHNVRPGQRTARSRPVRVSLGHIPLN